MLELEEAQCRILAALKILPRETVPLHAANGRFLADRIISEIDLPPFDNSAMDGYALGANDLQNATRDEPTLLQEIGKIPAGEFFRGVILPGHCARIFTGSPLPAGADAVAMQEDAAANPRNPLEIQFFDSVKPWENVRFLGEDVKKGAVLMEAGMRLNAANLSLLAAVGIEKVLVGRQPLTAILATGSELREAGMRLQAGQIFESNRIGIAALASQMGAIPRVFPIVADSLLQTKEAMARAFSECDVVITTGGVSVGELDFVKTAFGELGGRLDFWKISLKPGKPFVFGQLGEKFLFGLPGNPVSAFVTFILLVAPALAKLQGATHFQWPAQSGILIESLENLGDRRHFVRVCVDEKGSVRSAGSQASHIVSALAKSNGLVEIPARTVFAENTVVKVLRWEL
ncbi:MAG: gephyrin-like molybdotransferase Glp [Verrucomicrobiota bacterium]